jgi:hypothetical protein
MASIGGSNARVRALVFVFLRVLLGSLVAACTSACSGGSVFGRTYEYEEDVYVSLDGSAEIIVNASIPALVMLRGLDLNLDSAARFDSDHLRAAYASPVSQVSRVSRPWRKYGRRFIQVRVQVGDIRRLTEAPPFSWSAYELADKDGQYVYKQTVTASALRPGTMKNVGWDGSELVAFRLHLPSRITWHNSRDVDTNEPSDIHRGNILVWEQHLTDRLDGRPLAIEVRMERQSILYRTLWLFAGAFVAAVLVLGGLIWWTMRRGRSEAEGS